MAKRSESDAGKSRSVPSAPGRAAARGSPRRRSAASGRKPPPDEAGPAPPDPAPKLDPKQGPAPKRDADPKPGTDPPIDGVPALTIGTHRALIARRNAIIAALAADPRSARMLAANPALAFRAAGIGLSPAVANHILHAIQQPAAVRSRRAELTATLTESLGAAPRPSDPGRLATTLFDTLKLHPLATAGHDPVYVPVIPAGVQERLRALLPDRDHRLPARTPTAAGADAPDAPNAQHPPPAHPPPVWRLDLDAAVPKLARSRTRPKEVTLRELWFYLPEHALVRPLLELGILEVSVMPVLPPEAFAKVQGGAETGGVTDWIQSVTFPPRPGKRGEP